MPVPPIKEAIALLQDFSFGFDCVHRLQRAATIILANNIKPVYVTKAIKHLTNPVEEGRSQEYAQEYINMAITDLKRTLAQRKLNITY